MLIRDAELDSHIHIDFVPLADVLFNLLVFFLLATTVAQAELQMNIALPVAKSGAPISSMLRDMVVNVDRQGAIFVNGRQTTPEQLRDLVSGAVAANPAQKVTVRGDRAAAYASVVTVLDICKSAGIQQPYLDTRLGE